MTSFLDTKVKRDRQTGLDQKSTRNPDLTFVLVLLGGAGKDKCFTLGLKELQAYFARHFKGFKRRHKIQSLHCAVQPKGLHKFKSWDTLLDALKGTK